MNEELKSKSPEEQEDWFIGQISEDEIDLDLLLRAISEVVDMTGKEKAVEWCDLLRDCMAERKDFYGLWRVMSAEEGWHGQTDQFRQKCEDLLRAAMPGKKGEVFVTGAGFADSIPVTECLRRFGLLLELKDGVLCREKTWGFGIVRQADAFYAKVTVDFDQKRGHEMSFAYAAERLEILDDDHFLSHRHRDPESFRRMISEEPDELVRLIIRSYGPVSVVDLQDIMLDSGLSDSEWKTFWDKARKCLKADPMVDIPGRRSEPIVLRSEAPDFRSEWLAEIRESRDPSRIAELLALLEKESPDLASDPDIQEVVRDRLQFAIGAVKGKHSDTLGLLAMAGSRIQQRTGVEIFEEDRLINDLVTPSTCCSALVGMTGKQASSFLEYLGAHDRGALESLLLDHINEFPSASLNEIMAYLLASESSEQLVSKVRELVACRTCGPSMVYWLCRNTDKAFGMGMTQANELIIRVVDVLEQLYAGDDLKMQKQVRNLVSQARWLKNALREMSSDQREVFLKRVRGSSGWEATDRRSVLARIIKLYPELQDILSSGHDESVDERQKVRQTSWHSYSERQEALRKLVQEEIPANSREIAVARSYGDLRENAEYKAAKEHQVILQRRMGEMELDLQNVKGTDFQGVSREQVGPGTRVTLRMKDGDIVSYCILGEWDRDEELDIISSRSALAEAIAGASAGDMVTIPSPNGPVDCELVTVEALPPKVREWIGVRPS